MKSHYRQKHPSTLLRVTQVTIKWSSLCRPAASVMPRDLVSTQSYGMAALRLVDLFIWGQRNITCHCMLRFTLIVCLWLLGWKVCLCTTWVQCLSRPEEGSTSFGIGITESFCGVLGLNSGQLEEKSLLFNHRDSQIYTRVNKTWRFQVPCSPQTLCVIDVTFKLLVLLSLHLLRFVATPNSDCSFLRKTKTCLGLI